MNKQLKTVLKPLIKLDGVIAIFVYGSRVGKNKQIHKSSDIDIMVVADTGHFVQKTFRENYEREKVKIQSNEEKLVLHFQPVKPLAFMWERVFDFEPWIITLISSAEAIYDPYHYLSYFQQLVQRLDRKKHIISGAEERLEEAYTKLNNTKEEYHKILRKIGKILVTVSQVYLRFHQIYVHDLESVHLKLTEILKSHKMIQLTIVDDLQEFTFLSKKLLKYKHLPIEGEDVDRQLKKAKKFVRITEELIKEELKEEAKGNFTNTQKKITEYLTQWKELTNKTERALVNYYGKEIAKTIKEIDQEKKPKLENLVKAKYLLASAVLYNRIEVAKPQKNNLLFIKESLKIFLQKHKKEVVAMLIYGAKDPQPLITIITKDILSEKKEALLAQALPKTLQLKFSSAINFTLALESNDKEHFTLLKKSYPIYDPSNLHKNLLYLIEQGTLEGTQQHLFKVLVDVHLQLASQERVKIKIVKDVFDATTNMVQSLCIYKNHTLPTPKQVPETFHELFVKDRSFSKFNLSVITKGIKLFKQYEHRELHIDAITFDELSDIQMHLSNLADHVDSLLQQR